MGDDTRVHVVPLGDLIEHEPYGEECACGPSAVPVIREDGSCGWVMVHHSLDGRELTEPDEKTKAVRRGRQFR